MREGLEFLMTVEITAKKKSSVLLMRGLAWLDDLVGEDGLVELDLSWAQAIMVIKARIKKRTMNAAVSFPMICPLNIL